MTENVKKLHFIDTINYGFLGLIDFMQRSRVLKREGFSGEVDEESIKRLHDWKIMTRVDSGSSWVTQRH